MLLTSVLFLAGVALSQAQTYYDIYTSAGTGGETAADVASISSTYYSPSGSTTTTALYTNRDITWGSPGTLGGSSGSGVYTRLFAVQAPGSSAVEAGFNDPNVSYDQKSGVGSPYSVTAAQINTVTYGGVQYFELLFDGQESDDAISLNSLLVFTSPTAITSNAPGGTYPSEASIISFFQSNGGSLRYSLDSLDSSNVVTTDNTVLLSTVGGSGHGDNSFYLPTSIVQGSSPAGYDDYVYVFVKLGTTGTYNSINFGGSSTGEEFAYYAGSGSLPYAPEPSVYVTALALLCLAAVFEWRRRFTPKNPADSACSAS